MTLPQGVRRYMHKRYMAAFTFKTSVSPDVKIYDKMKTIKFIPKDLQKREDLIRYFCMDIQREASDPRTNELVVMFDTSPEPVKKMVAHKKRYGKETFQYQGNGHSYLPKQKEGLLPDNIKGDNWICFAGNYQLLQRELYPLIFNALMQCRYFVPRPGQKIILSGLPGQTRAEKIIPGQRFWERRTSTSDNMAQWQVHFWNEELEWPLKPELEAKDKDLYNRTFIIENVIPCQEFPQGKVIIREWEEAKNSISEADIRMFYFCHWYQNRNVHFILNDGDIFSIGILYAQERVVNDLLDSEMKQMAGRHIAELPFKDKELAQELGLDPNNMPDLVYVDIDLLFNLISCDIKLKGVQNKILTFVFLVIIQGSDFFEKPMPGIGGDFIWDIFFDNISEFEHLVMMSYGQERGTRAPKRTIVVDERAFEHFILLCYHGKFDESTRKIFKLPITRPVPYENLKKRTRCDAKNVPHNDVDKELPDRNKCRLWARQILWNLLYWKNGPLGHYCDPFEKFNGLPYFPYQKDPLQLLDYVSPKEKPLEMVFQTKRRKKFGGLSDKEKQEIQNKVLALQ